MSQTARSKSIAKILILALVLFVPGFLYLAMEKLGKHEYVKLPIYGEKQLTGEMKRVMGREIPDTLYHQLDPVTFTDSDGSEFVFLGNDSVITVAHLFYAGDSAFSNIMLNYMDRVATKFQNKALVELVSISVDPNDDVATLQSVGNKYGDLKGRRWHMVANPSTDIFKYAKDAMLLDALVDPSDSSKYIISDQIILLDSDHRIRGFYSIAQESEIKRLEDEIKVQLVEEVRNNPIKVERR